MSKTEILLIWLALLALLATTVGGSLIFSGTIGLAVSFGIAFAKAGTIYWKYMHVSEQSGLLRVIAFASCAWLLILLFFLIADHSTRGLG